MRNLVSRLPFTQFFVFHQQTKQSLMETIGIKMKNKENMKKRKKRRSIKRQIFLKEKCENDEPR